MWHLPPTFSKGSKSTLWGKWVDQKKTGRYTRVSSWCHSLKKTPVCGSAQWLSEKQKRGQRELYLTVLHSGSVWFCRLLTFEGHSFHLFSPAFFVSYLGDFFLLCTVVFFCSITQSIRLWNYDHTYISSTHVQIYQCVIYLTFPIGFLRAGKFGFYCISL